jgi:hypothetical protein
MLGLVRAFYGILCQFKSGLLSLVHVSEGQVMLGYSKSGYVRLRQFI